MDGDNFDEEGSASFVVANAVIMAIVLVLAVIIIGLLIKRKNA
jgi:hypothetical protein